MVCVPFPLHPPRACNCDRTQSRASTKPPSLTFPHSHFLLFSIANSAVTIPAAKHQTPTMGPLSLALSSSSTSDSRPYQPLRSNDDDDARHHQHQHQEHQEQEEKRISSSSSSSSTAAELESALNTTTTFPLLKKHQQRRRSPLFWPCIVSWIITSLVVATYLWESNSNSNSNSSSSSCPSARPQPPPQPPLGSAEGEIGRGRGGSFETGWDTDFGEFFIFFLISKSIHTVMM